MTVLSSPSSSGQVTISSAVLERAFTPVPSIRFVSSDFKPSFVSQGTHTALAWFEYSPDESMGLVSVTHSDPDNTDKVILRFRRPLSLDH